jgi:alpha-L-fucosidase
LENYHLITEFWESEKLVKMIRELQPHIVINNRSGVPGDYDTPEQEITASDTGRAWEVCQTIGDYSQSWCYQRYTPRPIRKSVGQLLMQLTSITQNEGNLLLNVGPKPDGTIPDEDAERLRGIGKWLRANGEAIYGSERSPIQGNSVGSWILKGNVGYLLLPCWAKDELNICNLGTPAESAQLLATGQPLAVSYDADRCRLVISGLPETPPDPDISVVKVVFPSRPKVKRMENRAAWLGVTV